MEDDDLLGKVGAGEMKAKSGKRDHEIYDNTYYIPNDKLRLLEIPMNSNLFFQMLLYYHAFYDIIYALLLIPSGIYKILIGGTDAFIIVSPALTIFYCITELFRLNFGYKGNINESFPELIAFIIQTFLFSIAFTLVPYLAQFKFPHEDGLYIINLIFLVFELIVGSIVMVKFSNTQSAAFYRRTAPLIDQKFRKKYEGHEEAGSNREIQLGLQKHNKMRDKDLFAESDR